MSTTIYTMLQILLQCPIPSEISDKIFILWLGFGTFSANQIREEIEEMNECATRTSRFWKTIPSLWQFTVFNNGSRLMTQSDSEWFIELQIIYEKEYQLTTSKPKNVSLMNSYIQKLHDIKKSNLYKII